MALEGRIAGVSGIVGGLLAAGVGQRQGWRIAFLVGLVAGPVWWLWRGAPPSAHRRSASAARFWRGPCVGVGTGLGSGCTSGHGVCGLARLSPRSLAATLTFMATAALTVLLVRHIL